MVGTEVGLRIKRFQTQVGFLRHLDISMDHPHVGPRQKLQRNEELARELSHLGKGAGKGAGKGGGEVQSAS